MNSEAVVQRSVLLAAGRGKRLGRLTEHVPKPMVHVRGVPVIEHVLTGIRDAGVTQFLLIVGYRAEVIQDYFGDGERWGVRIDYVLQETPNGTGAALGLGREWSGGAPVLASYGDILTDPAHYRALVGVFGRQECAAAIGINPVDDPSAGAAVYREGDRIVRVVEKPPPGESGSNWNVAGVSVYGPGVWPQLAALKLSPRGEYELTDAISGLIATGTPVYACELNGFWSDVGTPEALDEAERLYPSQR